MNRLFAHRSLNPFVPIEWGIVGTAPMICLQVGEDRHWMPPWLTPRFNDTIEDHLLETL